MSGWQRAQAEGAAWTIETYTVKFGQWLSEQQVVSILSGTRISLISLSDYPLPAIADSAGIIYSAAEGRSSSTLLKCNSLAWRGGGGAAGNKREKQHTLLPT